MGIVTGLAWTEMGGEILTTEATVMPGKGKLIITGKLGEVMQESAQAAMSLRALARGALRHRPASSFENFDIHIHLPEGAIPEGRPVGRRHHGHRAGVGAHQDPGAPRRGDDRRDHPCAAACCPSAASRRRRWPRTARASRPSSIPKENQKDLREIPKKIRDQLRIVPVEFVDDVLREALVLEKPEEFFRKPSPEPEQAADLSAGDGLNITTGTHLGRPLARSHGRGRHVDLGFFAPPNAPAVRHARR